MTTEFRNLLLLRETSKAIQVQQTHRRGDNFQWIPISVITYRKNYAVDKETGDQRIDLNIEDWFVEKEGFALTS